MEPYIKPGLKLRILNETGVGRTTRFFDAETGVEFTPSGVTYPIKVLMEDSGAVKMELTMFKVPVDLVGTVVGMKINENAYRIEVNPNEYDVRVMDTKDGLKHVYFERKK